MGSSRKEKAVRAKGWGSTKAAVEMRIDLHRDLLSKAFVLHRRVQVSASSWCCWACVEFLPCALLTSKCEWTKASLTRYEPNLVDLILLFSEVLMLPPSPFCLLFFFHLLLEILSYRIVIASYTVFIWPVLIFLGNVLKVLTYWCIGSFFRRLILSCNRVWKLCAVFFISLIIQ